MNMEHAVQKRGRRFAGDDAHERLLAEIPVAERRLQLAGVSTSVLEGGDGLPIVLLHGPGEFAAKWLRVIPDLVRTHRVVAPDLPGHSAVGDGAHARHEFVYVEKLVERSALLALLLMEPPLEKGDDT